MTGASALRLSAVVQPERVRLLPVDRHKRPVPWFVSWVDGKPEFRLVRPGAFREAVSKRLCWVCGVPFLRQEDRCFVIGPMCALNRVSSEPPSHLGCALYSAMACPFLTRPDMVRRTSGLEDLHAVRPAGVMVERNPGVTLVWTVKYNGWHEFKDTSTGGSLINVGSPKSVAWYCEGRPATRSEVLRSVDSGLPALYEVTPESDVSARAGIQRRYDEVLALLPGQAAVGA